MSEASGGLAGAHSASASLLGYLAQEDYALLLALQKMHSQYDFAISLETVDDIAFHSPGGSIAEAVQTKHHIRRPGNLGDTSEDLWKTIRNWIQDQLDSEAALVLVSTSTAVAGAAASYLRVGSDRDPPAARRLLDAVASAATNQANRSYYAAYSELSDAARLNLLSRVTIIDGSADIVRVNHELLLALRTAAPLDRRQALADRLRGWWHRRVVVQLMSRSSQQDSVIGAVEIESELFKIQQALRDDNLPIDYDTAPYPSDHEAEKDDRVFVTQLRWIMMSSARIRQCVYDHNRAFWQRSRWQREQLTFLGELDQYDRRLIDEWRRYFTPARAALDEEDSTRWALDAFDELDKSALPLIRGQVVTEWVANGSLHMLADQGRIGWHPDWLKRVQEILGQDQEARGSGVA